MKKTKQLNIMESFTVNNMKNQENYEKSDDDFSVKSIDFNEVVKIQNPKFKVLDHSASYSSLGTKHNLSFGGGGGKGKKNISDRI